MQKYYSYRHRVGLEETNLVGNVYFSNHLRWQGLCREQFLMDHAPGVLKRLQLDLVLVTTRCSCEYLAELEAFEELEIQMTLDTLSQNRIAMDFQYFRWSSSGLSLVARGSQEVACMTRRDGKNMPIPIPPELETALARYRTA